jgi:hypothetical protein
MSSRQNLANIWFLLTFFVFLAIGCANGAGQGSIKIPIGSGAAAARASADGSSDSSDTASGKAQTISPSNVYTASSDEIDTKIRSISGATVQSTVSALTDLDEGTYVTQEATLKVGVSPVLGLFDFIISNTQVSSETFSYDPSSGGGGIHGAIVPIVMSFDLRKNGTGSIVGNIIQYSAKVSIKPTTAKKKKDPSNKDAHSNLARWEIFTPNPADETFKNLMLDQNLQTSDKHYETSDHTTAFIRKTQDSSGSVDIEISGNGLTEKSQNFSYILILVTTKQQAANSTGNSTAGANDATGGRAPQGSGTGSDAVNGGGDDSSFIPRR